MTKMVVQEAIENKIIVLRGKKVMLDRDLARLYNVKPIALRQQVKRNKERFPLDFMFKLSVEEAGFLVSQNVIPSRKSLGGFLPFAFTEVGVAMLSSVLNSRKAALVNIQIMRAFIRLREMVVSNAGLRHAIENLEKRVDVHDRKIGAALNAVKYLLEPPEKTKSGRKMGFVG